jgi:hypothetical protein
MSELKLRPPKNKEQSAEPTAMTDKGKLVFLVGTAEADGC